MTDNHTHTAQDIQFAAAVQAATDADHAFHALDVNATSAADYDDAYDLMNTTRQIAIDLRNAGDYS